MTALVTDNLLHFNVAALDDLEDIRIAFANRLRSLTSEGVSEKGHEWGFGFPEDAPEVQAYASIVEQLEILESDAIKGVEKAMKASPLAGWVKEQKGIGNKQAARLLAAINDPYWHDVQDRPRTVGELWAYCGMHVKDGRAPRRAKGQQSNWNADARMRVYLIAKSVEKQKAGSKYRDLYDTTKAHYQGAVHTGYDCPPCHAKDGDPLKPGHIQSRALRRVAKEVLKDMWLASKAYHEEAAKPV